MIFPIQVLNRLGPGDEVVLMTTSHTVSVRIYIPVSVAKNTGRLPLTPEKTASPAAK